MVVPAAVGVAPRAASLAGPVREDRAPGPEEAGPQPPGSEDCLASTLCSVKAHVRWHTPAWSPETCRDIASAVSTAARKYDLSPTLLLAVMINESDLDEKAFRVTMRGDRIYAKDSGLMGIRCVLDRRGRCTNSHLKGMSWKALMDPLTNIDIGARELARWRTAGVARVTVRVRDGSGHLVLKQKAVPCQHKTHAFWAHYNHGPIYIDHGPARHYPHRVAVLDYALAHLLSVEAPELDGRITIRDPGQRARTPDRPVEDRYRKLCRQIGEAGGRCSHVAALPASSGN
jgi:hypothetical protein